MGRHRRRSGGVVTRRRLLLALGAGLSAAGLTSTGAFSAVQSSRTTTIGVASDSNGYLGMTGLGNPDATPTFANGFSGEMDLTLDAVESGVEWDVGDDGSYVQDPVTLSIVQGTSVQVSARGADEITVDGTGIVREGGTEVARIVFRRTLDVSQASLVQEIQGSASSAGRSGKYEFQLENTGDVDVSLVGVGINETTNPNAAVVDGGEYLSTVADGQVVTSPIPVDSSTPTEDTRVDFDTTVSLDAGQTKLFTFDKFQKDGGGGGGGGPPGGGGGPPGGGGGPPHADMRGEDVRATFYFGDGSSGTVDLCIDGCDF